MLYAHELNALRIRSAKRHCVKIIFTLAASVATCSSTLYAQNAARNPRGKGDPAAGGAPTNGAALEIAKADGKLAAQQGQAIKITTEEKKDLFLVVSQQTSLKYSGEADPKWLSPGLMVRFSTSFDGGKPVGTVKSLEVFMPVRSNRMTMEQTREQTPGIYQEGKAPLPGAKGLFAEDKKDAKKPANAQTPAQSPPATTGGSQSYRAVGTLRGVHQNTLLISAGAQPLQIELDPSATITVTASDLSFAAPGDTVSVSGLRNPAQPDWIQAEKIDVKAAKKLSQPQSPPRGGRMRGNARGRGANNDADKAQNDQTPGDANDKTNAHRKPAAGDRRAPAPGKPPGR